VHNVPVSRGEINKKPLEIKEIDEFDIRAALYKVGLTQIKAADILGVSHRAMRYYVSGQRDLPEPAEKLLRLLAGGKITIFSAVPSPPSGPER
jgi:DNA-binding transcriptional regulator YiaG